MCSAGFAEATNITLHGHSGFRLPVLQTFWTLSRAAHTKCMLAVVVLPQHWRLTFELNVATGNKSVITKTQCIHCKPQVAISVPFCKGHTQTHTGLGQV